VATKHPSPWTERAADTAYATGTSAVVFLLFVAVGCAYIVAAKLAGIGPFYVTFVPVGTMLAYALLIFSARGLRLRDDQSGDNLYYMGFLFTLTSLGVSLYQFTAARAAEEIVQNFGIAIGSTIAGIGLRVIFNQMRRDPVEVERMMRLELAEAARRVRRELDSTVVEFGYHRRSAQQAAADSFNQVTEKFDEIVGKFLGSLEEITAKTLAPVEAASQRSADAIMQASEGIGAKLAESGRQISAASEHLSERAAAISAALDQVTAKLSAMQTPERVIEIRLEPVTASLAQAAERLAAQTGSQASAVKEALETANAAAARSIDLVMELRQDLDTANSTNRATLEAAAGMVKAVAKALDEFRANSTGYAEVLRASLEKTDATMRTFTDLLVRYGVEAATQSDDLRQLLPAVEASVRSLAAASERISGVVEDLRASRRAPRREIID
jgi:methyl-accepting chemotaxis protein